MEALKALDPAMIKKFLQTTLATNFIKFPLFEATSMIMQGVDIPPHRTRSSFKGSFHDGDASRHELSVLQVNELASGGGEPLQGVWTHSSAGHHLRHG